MADVDGHVPERTLDSDSLDLTVDNCQLSKREDILLDTAGNKVTSESKPVSNSKLPNGIIPCDSNKQNANCVCNQNEKVMVHQEKCSDNFESASKLCLQNSSGQEHGKKQNELTDSADSGVHSGPDNGSDVKSSSSSPGLSSESSVQDLSEKDELKKCDSEEPIEITDRPRSSDDEVVAQLAKSVTNVVSIREEKCDSDSVDIENGIEYVVYRSELQMPDIMKLITKDLSEPYSIYTYRYFIHNWPKLCFLAKQNSQCVGAIVCKLDLHKKMVRRGYIAMLAVDQSCRRKGIGSHLVLKAIRAMIADDCDEVVLETEITNRAALRLYENLGFVRDKRLFRYYLNGVDALRLKLWLR